MRRKDWNKYVVMFVPDFVWTLRQYLLEDFEVSKFTDMNAYKNYFGEKRCLLNYFYNFYASWWLFPAVLSIPLICY